MADASVIPLLTTRRGCGKMQSQVNATHDVNTRAGAGASARCGEAGRELDTVDLLLSALAYHGHDPLDAPLPVLEDGASKWVLTYPDCMAWTENR